MNSRELLQWAARQTDDKRLECELLLCNVLHTSRALLMAHDNEPVAPEREEEFRALVTRYAGGEPMQYLLGTTSFMGLDFRVTPAVLIPRFDTERLVEQVLTLLEPVKNPVVLDVCTGSGAIAVSVSHYRKDARVYAGDLSEAALEVAAQNNAQCGTSVQFRRGNLLEPFQELAGTLDLLVSNPPYITTQEMEELAADVRREPRMALWGGMDGLYFYRKLTEGACAMLKAGGWLAYEVGYQQGTAVQNLLTEAGFTGVTVLQDWQGLDRVVYGQYNR